MPTAIDHESAIDDILNFWFVTANKKWFGPEASKLDKTVAERFGGLVETARLTDDLDDIWLKSASGSLALILLLDQFTRNIYRPGNHPQPGLSWSGDAKALKIASVSVAKGYDLEVQRKYSSQPGLGFNHRQFFYLPFMHAEDLGSQIAAVALCEGIATELEMEKMKKEAQGQQLSEEEKGLLEVAHMGVSSAIRHRDCVAKLGRFPARNAPLGRASTEADKQFLKEHPEGF